MAQSGVVVTAAIASGTGTLGGTATATTNASGVASFTNLSIAGSGAYTLSFSATGLTAVTSSAISVATATVPPPTGTGEPTYTTATDKLIVQDNFDGYTGIASGSAPFTARYPNYRVLDAADAWVPIGNDVSLVPGRNATGQALHLQYGGPNGASDIIVGTEGKLGQVGGWNGTLPEKAGPYSHFFLTTWIRFSVGADPAGYDDSGVKGVMLWHTGNQRYQHSPHRLKDYTGGRYAETHWDAGPPHPPNATTGLSHWKTADGQAPRFSPYTDGNWHRFTVEVYAGDPSGHRGERWWLDGVLMFDNMDNVGNLAWGADYTYTYPITHWMVFGNYIRGDIGGASPPFTVDFDDWIAWTR